MYRVGKEEAEAVSRVVLSGSYFKTRNVYNETEQADKFAEAKHGTVPINTGKHKTRRK